MFWISGQAELNAFATRQRFNARGQNGSKFMPVQGRAIRDLCPWQVTQVGDNSQQWL
jgi:hypothetical protein